MVDARPGVDVMELPSAPRHRQRAPGRDNAYSTGRGRFTSDNSRTPRAMPRPSVTYRLTAEHSAQRFSAAKACTCQRSSSRLVAPIHHRQQQGKHGPHGREPSTWGLRTSQPTPVTR